MKNNTQRAEALALLTAAAKLAEECDLHGFCTEEDLLNLDEMLNEVLAHPGCDATSRRWINKQLSGIGQRLDSGDFDA